MYDLKRIQAIELEMLREVKRICNAHDIPYYLAQGTLLGAVRHGGFIPWDDDADVLIPFEQMDRLFRYFQAEAGAECFITDRRVELHNPSTWAKIRRNGTSSMPVGYQAMPIHWGICIDLFPYYGVSDRWCLRKLEVLLFKVGRKLLMASMTPYDKDATLLTRLVEKLPLALRRKLADLCIKPMERHRGEPTQAVFVTCKGGHILDRSWIEGTETCLDFEGDAYRVPSNYDVYLTRMYGDYMTPPPESEQSGHEQRIGDIIWDCEKSYTAYQ